MNITHNWLGSLRAIFWLFWIVCNNCWWINRVLLTVTELHLYDWLMNLCWYLFEEKPPPPSRLTSLLRILWNIDGRLWGEDITVQLNIPWSDQFICNQSYTAFKSCIYVRGDLSVFSCIQLICPYTKVYYIRHINVYLNQLYKNREIDSIVYINSKCKCFFSVFLVGYNGVGYKKTLTFTIDVYNWINFSILV